MVAGGIGCFRDSETYTYTIVIFIDGGSRSESVNDNRTFETIHSLMRAIAKDLVFGLNFVYLVNLISRSISRTSSRSCILNDSIVTY